jgi:hypothetical protein
MDFVPKTPVTEGDMYSLYVSPVRDQARRDVDINVQRFRWGHVQRVHVPVQGSPYQE